MTLPLSLRPLAILISLTAAQSIAANPSLPSGNPPPGPPILYWPLADAPQLRNEGIWTAEPILVSGASAYRSGEFVYQDFLYDDRGAAAPGATSSAGTGGTIAAALGQGAGGTYTYPLDAVYARNAADLVEIRLKLLESATAVRITYNALLDPERVATTVAFGDSAAPRAIPHGANASLPAELFATVHGAVVEFVDAASGLLTSTSPLAATVSLERRQVEFELPHSVFDPRGQTAVRIAAATGLWDPATASYAVPHTFASNPPSGAPTETNPGGGGLLVAPAAFFNVAFRFAEVANTSNVWREKQQSAALATGDLSPFFALVDFTKLAAGVDDDMPGQSGGVPQTGYMNRIVASHFEDAQGRGSDPGGDPNGRYPCQAPTCIQQFSGQLQPYSIYVPSRPPPSSGYGVTLSLHACGTNHNVYLGSQRQVQYGERGTGSLVITGLARGECYRYYDQAGADIFEVWADIAQRYRLDPDYVAITGASMGGYGTYKYAGVYPDLFARAGPVEPSVASGVRYLGPGTPAPGTFGEAEVLYPLLPAFLNVPVLSFNFAADQSSTLPSQLPVRDTLDALGYRYGFYVISADHIAGGLNDQEQIIADYFGEARVERNPARVRYVLNTHMSQPEFGLDVDHVYWVYGLSLRDASVFPPLGLLDIRSHGIGVAEPVALPTEESAGTITGGLSPALAYTSWTKDWEPLATAPSESRLSIEIENLATLAIDASRARTTQLPLVLDVVGDGPSALTLLGSWDSPLEVTKDGVSIGLRAVVEGAVVLTDNFSGSHRYVLPEPAPTSLLLAGTAWLYLLAGVRRQRRRRAASDWT